MNSYADDPARGLSRLQIVILVWLLRNPVRQWHGRPHWHGKAMRPASSTARHDAWPAAQAVCNSLRRLEERGHVQRLQSWHGHAVTASPNPKVRMRIKTYRAELTPVGKRVAQQLVKAGKGDAYGLEDRDGLKKFLELVAALPPLPTP